MNRFVASALSLCLAAAAHAQSGNAANSTSGMPDMTKMGPGTRMVQHEAADKKAIAAMLKASMDAMDKGDLDASASTIDFPVLMTTDSPSTGEASAVEMSREQWIGVMKPFAGQTPKDVKFTSKHNISMLTDSLAQVVSDYTVTMGGHKMIWKSADLVVKKNGKWLVKAMTEGGWGDMPTGEQAANK
jgi:hypothetical protein